MAKGLPLPEGFHTVVPYLIVPGCAKLITLLEQVFDAKETFRMNTPSGEIGHAEVRLGDCTIEMADSGDMWPPTRTLLHVYVPDCDETFQKAVQAGFEVKQELKDQFYGERSATLTDPFGNMWSIATRIEDLTEQEIRDRADKLFGGKH
jgi:PhnB protein